jgi:hypothetical protein
MPHPATIINGQQVFCRHDRIGFLDLKCYKFPGSSGPEESAQLPVIAGDVGDKSAEFAATHHRR